MADTTLPHDTMQPQALAITIIFPVISTIMVGLRVWTRAAMKQFAWDDALVVSAWVLAVAYAGVEYKWIKVNWFGYHIWDIPKPNLETDIYGAKLNMAQQLIYNPILCIVKASVIVFLLRLGDKRKYIRWSMLVFFWFNLGHMISVFFAAMTQCLPIHMYWDHFKTDQMIDGHIVNPNYSCFNEEVFSLTTAGLAILTDILILMIPVAIMWSLRMPLRSKVAVGVVLSLGWVVAAISMFRLKVFYDYWRGTGTDPTYGLNQTVSGIEVNTAIITSCGPAMKALITSFAPRFFGTRTNLRPTADIYATRDGYELSGRSGRSPVKNSVHYTSATISTRIHAEGRDDDGDSQEAIITSENFGPEKDEHGIRVEKHIDVTSTDRDEAMSPYGSFGRAL